jgi:hypothetical protein
MELPMDKDVTNLVSLSDTKRLTVAEGDPDVRGWRVLSSDRRELGKVADLLVDPGLMRVRYLVVTLDDYLTGANDRRVLLPIGTAELDDEDDRVLVNARASGLLADLPPYEGGPLSRTYEEWLMGRLGVERRPTDTPLYAGESFDDDRFYRARRRLTDREVRRAQDIEADRHTAESARQLTDTPQSKLKEEIRVPVAPNEEVVVTRGTVENGDLIIRKQKAEQDEEALRRRHLDPDSRP